MSKQIQAWRIDAITGEVKALVFESGDTVPKIRARLNVMYKALSMEGLRPCDDINTVRIDDRGHYLYVDGEGVLKDPVHFILWKGYPQALAGHALVVRIDGDGEAADVKVSDAWVKERVKLAKLKMLGFVQRTEAREIFGKPGTAIIRIPVFVERRAPGEVGEPLTMEKIAEHLGMPGEALEWTVLPSEDDLEDFMVQQTEAKDGSGT
jgi:hypothetical protein